MNEVQALHDAGLAFSEVVADGKFHRARKPNDAQWYIANQGATGTGKAWLQLSAGDFRETGGKYEATLVWRSWRNGDFTREELRQIRAHHKRAKEQASLRLSEEHQAARQEGMRIWSRAKTGEHPYLRRKRLPPYNTRVYGPALLVPVFSVDGAFTSMQAILPDGSKKNMPGGRMAGCYHPINYFFGRERKVYVAEGWSTAAVIAEVKKVPVVAAFSAGNLLPVAKGIRRENPTVQIVIAADNDRFTEGNPGMRLANKAAHAVNGKVIVPDFSEFLDAPNPTDWWDYFALTGRI